MKIKVGAIEAACIFIFISGIIYLECQWDFLICYEILQFIKFLIKGVLLLFHLKGTVFYNVCKDFYCWLLTQPSSNVFTKMVEMIASGVFGSALVTAIIYFVEYRMQNKSNILELVEIQKKHIRRINELAYISAFADDQNDVKRNAYLEYAENYWKLSSFEEHEQRIKTRRGMSNKDKRKEIQRRTPVYQFEHAQKYKEWYWNNINEAEKKEIIAEGYKEQFLKGALQDLFAQTDLELAAAFYDYREIAEIDLTRIQYLVDEICFMGLKRKKCKENKLIINKAIRLDRHYEHLITTALSSAFEIEDFPKYFRGNRKQLLSDIEALQVFFFERDLKMSNAAKNYHKWEKEVKEIILNQDASEETVFSEPQNAFEAFGCGYALSPSFLKKARTQNWDYHKYVLPDFSKMKY